MNNFSEVNIIAVIKELSMTKKRLSVSTHYWGECVKTKSRIKNSLMTYDVLCRLFNYSIVSSVSSSSSSTSSIA